MKLWRLLLWTNSRRFRYVPISVYSRVVSHSCLLPDHKVLNDQGTNSKWRNARSWWSPRVHGIALASISLLLCGDSNRKGSELAVAAKNNDVITIKRLINNGVDVNSRHDLGWGAIHAAVVNGRANALKVLLEHGADVNLQDEFSSVYRVARQKRYDSYAVARVRNHEFTNRFQEDVNFSGFTALHYAVVLNDHNIIKILLENGADPSIRNHKGLKPSAYCTTTYVLKMLNTQEAKQAELKQKEMMEERRRYPLEERLGEHIVGQEGPIAVVGSAIRSRENGWADEDRPLVFLFLGSSGVGKTELAKQVAAYFHRDNKQGFIRIDMSEYQEKHEVAKFIGAPPGYLGYDQGGQLTSALQLCDNAVVLFDEVDKAHPDVLTIMLQLFDEGRITDGKGRTVECKEAIFIMTSNVANEEIASHALKLRREAEVAKQHRSTDLPEKTLEISREFKDKTVEPILKRHFRRDEFLGRINEMVYFLPFSRTELNQLVEKELKFWKKKAAERHGIDLTWSPEVLDVLADGYNIRYGARSLKHEVDRRVVNQLAAAFEQQLIGKDSRVHLRVEDSDSQQPTIKLQLLNNDDIPSQSPVDPSLIQFDQQPVH
ncbi:mitochondrial disaggregase-like [Dysidea avara]|uniref:mitochondrial disaggregase-like n=1 Tax=Dysidea avara TaxID=196820 RepID=UPI00332AF2A7